MSNSVFSGIRKSLAGLVFVAALGASAHAQSWVRQAKVDIPFAFQDGSARLNPGVYTIGIQTGNLMLVRGSYGARSAFSSVIVGETGQPATKGKVVFHKYGDRYFLREVWMPGSAVHVECPTSKAEKNLQKELQLASTSQAARNTEVASLEIPN